MEGEYRYNSGVLLRMLKGGGLVGRGKAREGLQNCGFCSIVNVGRRRKKIYSHSLGDAVGE